jgi:hypothetical protein
MLNLKVCIGLSSVLFYYKISYKYIIIDVGSWRMGVISWMNNNKYLKTLKVVTN